MNVLFVFYKTTNIKQYVSRVDILYLYAENVHKKLIGAIFVYKIMFPYNILYQSKYEKKASKKASKKYKEKEFHGQVVFMKFYIAVEKKRFIH